jgi:hypothetical protein
MDIAGIYDLNVSFDYSSDTVPQRFYIVPKLTETCILGIDFITKNVLFFMRNPMYQYQKKLPHPFCIPPCLPYSSARSAI